MGFIRVDSAFAKRRGEISRIILGSKGWVNWSMTWCKYIYYIYILYIYIIYYIYKLFESRHPQHSMHSTVCNSTDSPLLWLKRLEKDRFAETLKSRLSGVRSHQRRCCHSFTALVIFVFSFCISASSHLGSSFSVSWCR